jgi:hypothetical protein
MLTKLFASSIAYAIMLGLIKLVWTPPAFDRLMNLMLNEGIGGFLLAQVVVAIGSMMTLMFVLFIQLPVAILK